MMSNEEVQKILDELHEVNIEHLTGKAKRLFEAIMKICDQRDTYKNELDKLGIKIHSKNEELKEYKWMYESLNK